MPVKCRLCDGAASPWGDRDDVALYRCAACGFVSGQPAGRFDSEDHYEAYYRRPHPPVPNIRYHEWLRSAERAVGCGRLLEVGAGTGGFARVALARGWRVDATELSKSGLEALRRTGATVVAGDVTAAGYGDAQFDLVASFEVLEHLPGPRSHLGELWRITRPGGLLILTTPNFNGLSRRWLGMRWRVIDPEHLGYFASSSLSGVLSEVGYKHVRVRSRSLDVLSWRHGIASARVARFDPHASARLRDTVQASAILRFGRTAVNGALWITGLGDSLLAWARR